jgi:hypothetical protein
MRDFIFFMHDDATNGENDWEPYLATLKNRGFFSEEVARLEMASAFGRAVQFPR